MVLVPLAGGSDVLSMDEARSMIIAMGWLESANGTVEWQISSRGTAPLTERLQGSIVLLDRVEVSDPSHQVPPDDTSFVEFDLDRATARLQELLLGFQPYCTWTKPKDLGNVHPSV